MSATATTRVEIDDTIRGQPDLLRAVEAATGYLEEQAVDVAPPAVVRWDCADRDGKLLRLTLSDHTADQGRRVSRNYWTAWVMDPTGGRLCVLQAWGALLGLRSDDNMVRINQLAAKLKKELSDAGQDVD